MPKLDAEHLTKHRKTATWFRSNQIQKFEKSHTHLLNGLQNTWVINLFINHNFDKEKGWLRVFYNPSVISRIADDQKSETKCFVCVCVCV